MYILREYGSSGEDVSVNAVIMNAQHPNAQHPNIQHPNVQHPNAQHPNAQHRNTQHLTVSTSFILTFTCISITQNFACLGLIVCKRESDRRRKQYKEHLKLESREEGEHFDSHKSCVNSTPRNFEMFEIVSMTMSRNVDDQVTQ